MLTGVLSVGKSVENIKHGYTCVEKSLFFFLVAVTYVYSYCSSIDDAINDTSLPGLIMNYSEDIYSTCTTL